MLFLSSLKLDPLLLSFLPQAFTVGTMDADRTPRIKLPILCKFVSNADRISFHFTETNNYQVTLNVTSVNGKTKVGFVWVETHFLLITLISATCT